MCSYFLNGGRGRTLSVREICNQCTHFLPSVTGNIKLFTFYVCFDSQGHLLPVKEITCLAQIVCNLEVLGTVKDTPFAGTLMVKMESADHLLTAAVVETKIISIRKRHVARLAVMQVFLNLVLRMYQASHHRKVPPVPQCFRHLGFERFERPWDRSWYF